MRTAVYAGAFDPITLGHLDIAARGAKMFDHVIIAIAKNSYKNVLFSIDERFALISEATKNIPNVSVEVFEGLLVDFCQKKQVSAIIRGLRAVSDFEIELQMALMNRQLNSNMDTVFLMASSQYLFISSSLIKNAASVGGNVSSFVPPNVQEALAKKFTGKNTE